MNKVILATGSDYKYLQKIQPYLSSLDKNSNFDENILVFIGDEDFHFENKSISLTKLPKTSILSLNTISCLQHGEFAFAPYFDKFEDSDIIFFTDGDMFLQRSITTEEKTMYSNLNDGDVYIGYNSSKDDTLQRESPRIGYKNIMYKEFERDWNSIKIYNTGVVGMNKKSWKKLAKDYIELYPLVDTMFTHYAKQQWLISFLIGTDSYFNIIEMGYDIHNHTHYASPIGTTQDANHNVFFDNKLVLFKHKWD